MLVDPPPYLNVETLAVHCAVKQVLDNKKSRKNFPYVGRGGGQPTYGKFHMFHRFFLKASLKED